MKNYFGKEVAERYDDDQSIYDPSVINPVVNFLADLAGSGAALELGIETGRIALPLKQVLMQYHFMKKWELKKLARKNLRLYHGEKFLYYVLILKNNCFGKI